jgi:hypothetical protein
LNGGAAHVADLFRPPETAHAVQGLAIVSHDEIMRLPFVDVDEGGLGRVLGEIA